MSAAPEIVVGARPGSVHERAARRFASAAAAAIAARGRFAVALAGGSTPRPLYERLAAPPHRDAIDWARVDVFWGDERCVPPDHPDSNHRLAREALLDRVPVPAGRIHRIEGEDPDPDRAARRYEAELRRVLDAPPPGVPRLDLALLGLGEDGHTASLFPGSPALAVDDRLVVAVRASEAGVGPPVVDRITLTPPALAAARAALFLVVGEAKAEAVRATLERSGESGRWPARTVDPAAATWLLDAAAAGRLEGLASAAGEAP